MIIPRDDIYKNKKTNINLNTPLEDPNKKIIIENYLKQSGPFKNIIEPELHYYINENNVKIRTYNTIDFALIIEGQKNTNIPTLIYNTIKNYSISKINDLIHLNQDKLNNIPNNQNWAEWLIKLSTAQNTLNLLLLNYLKNIKLEEDEISDINIIIESNQKINPFFTIFTSYIYYQKYI